MQTCNGHYIETIFDAISSLNEVIIKFNKEESNIPAFSSMFCLLRDVSLQHPLNDHYYSLKNKIMQV